MKATIQWHNGSPNLQINGESYLPISYRSFYPQAGTVKSFYEKGFSLYQLFPSGILCSLKIPYSQCGEVWTGEGEYNWDNLRNHIEMFLQSAPDAKFALLVHLDTRDWYLAEHPKALDSFHNLAQMCRDAGWRNSAVRFLQDIVDFVEREYPERVYALHLFAGHTCEWYAHYPQEGLAESKQLTESYRDYFQTDGDVPNHRDLTGSAQGIFRHPVKNQKAVDFWRFYNDIIAETICYFAHKAKEITNGRLLTGVFYGYTMCFSHGYQRGHSAFHKVLSCPDVDIIFAPAAYRPFRGPDAGCGFNLAVDSIRFHKKLYLHEIDNTTSLTTHIPFANAVQGLHQRPDSLEDTVSYCRRETARALEHGGGYWWFDMWDGWFADEQLMEALSHIKKASKAVYAAGTRSVAEIAVFIDADSTHYLADGETHDTVYITNEREGGLAVQYSTVYAQQEEWNKVGAPVNYFDSQDLLHPDFSHSQYKLYVFPNLYAPSAELKTAIAKLRAAGKSCLFLYAPGFIDGEECSVDAMEKLTGIQFSVADPETDSAISSDGCQWGGEPGITPLFTAATGEVLAKYSKTGEPAGVVNTRDHGLDAWFGVGPVPASILRKIAKQAGVFIWYDGDDPVYINEGMLGIYSPNGGERTIRLPADCKLVSLYTDEEYETQNCKVTLFFQPKELKLFLRK